MCWVLHAVGALQDTQITHVFNSVLLIMCPFFRGFVFGCYQGNSFAQFGVVQFLLGSVTRVHLRLKFPQGLLQRLGSTISVIVPHLEFNYNASVVCC